MSSNRTRPGPRYDAFLRLLRTADTLWNASRVYLSRWDLSPSQFNVLNLVHDRPEGMTQIDLGRLLLMHRSNVTGLVDRLEKRGLVKRHPNPEDRRVHLILLTTAGQKLMNDILPHYYSDAEAVWGTLSVRQAGQLVQQLEVIAANAERIAGQRSDTQSD